jgi:hypothetical protein
VVLLFSLLGYEANSGAFAFFIKGRVARHTPFWLLSDNKV